MELLTLVSAIISHRHIAVALTSFIDVLLITIISFWNKEDAISFSSFEKKYISFVSIAIILSTISQNSRISLLAFATGDIIATLPYIFSAWKSPENDRPYMWTLNSFGYLCIMQGHDFDFTNLCIPVYTVACCSLIAIPLIAFRLKNHIPLREWV